jgi:NAD synthase
MRNDQMMLRIDCDLHIVADHARAAAPVFAGLPRDVTEENLQSRTRGTILMAISNKFGVIVVTTANKSENIGWLCHALRRHERRLQSDQGSLQDRGLPAGAAAQWLEARARWGPMAR